MKIEKVNGENNPDLVYSSQLFHERWKELEANWNDLHSDGAPTEIEFVQPGPGKLWSPGFDYNYHRLKGLYLDYRFFDAQKEITNFKRMCNRVSKEFDSPIAQGALKALRVKWEDVPDLRTLHGYKFREIVDLYFNASLFHQDQSKIANFRSVMDSFNDGALPRIPQVTR